MSDDLRSLYQETILDHGKRPRNFGALRGATHHARGHNPLCGDRLSLHLRVDDDRVAEARFEGAGCAISTASASLMTEALRGKSVHEARELFDGLHALLTGEGEPAEDLGKLSVFSGVRSYPLRVKCATLAWHTLVAALDGEEEATTED